MYTSKPKFGYARTYTYKQTHKFVHA